MEKVKQFDRLVSEKVYKKCADCGYTKYTEIAFLIGTTDSFIKAVFSEYRKKLNLYHLMKLSYELKCSINCFLPEFNDYCKYYSFDSEYECFLKSIEEDCI